MVGPSSIPKSGSGSGVAESEGRERFAMREVQSEIEEFYVSLEKRMGALVSWSPPLVYPSRAESVLHFPLYRSRTFSDPSPLQLPPPKLRVLLLSLPKNPTPSRPHPSLPSTNSPFLFVRTSQPSWTLFEWPRLRISTKRGRSSSTRPRKRRLDSRAGRRSTRRIFRR